VALSSHVWRPISWPVQGEGGHLKERGHERDFSPIMILLAYLAHFYSGFLFHSCTFTIKCQNIEPVV